MPDRSALFDLQVNGFAGVDFQNMEMTSAQLLHAVKALARHRAGGVFLTLITDSIDSLCRKLERIEQFRQGDPRIAAIIAGYHIEGPYLSPKSGFHGAHPPEKMKAPDCRELRRLRDASGGNIRLVTMAPEWKGSGEFIADAVSLGIVVSLGHTDASMEEIDLAIRAGASLCTHLGNGTPGTMHRFENVVQRLLSRDELTACFIPDGVHIPPYALKNFFRAKPPGKVLITTDCMSAAGMPPGAYPFADMRLEVGPDRVVRMPGQTTFAGSALCPDEAVENMARFIGISPEEAWEIGSNSAARFFHLSLPSLRELSTLMKS